MKKDIPYIRNYSILFVVAIFALFFYTLFFGQNFQYFDYALFLILGGVLIFTMIFGIIPGLVLNAVIIFIYSTVVYLQLWRGASTIWTLNYLWFFAYPVLTVIVGQMQHYLKELYDECSRCNSLSSSAITIDEITGFGNGREFLRDLNIEMARAKRHSVDLTISLLEIQYFEELISLYGKSVTKDIFKQIAEGLNKSTRIEDLRYRIDENMLALILPHTDIEPAEIVKNRLKANLSHIEIEGSENRGKYVIEMKIGMLRYNDEILTPMEYKALCEKELEYDV